MITKTAIVIPDQHFPLHDQSAVNCALEIIKIAKPDMFINLGDVGEWETVSAWRWKDKKQPPLEYQLPLIDEEIEAVNDGIDQFDKVLDHLRDKYNLTWFDQPADAWRKLSPKIAAKIDELEERINKLEK